MSHREETRAAFYHGYRSYMDYGFPADELRPLSCIGRGSDKLNPYSVVFNEISWCRRNIGINDVCGDFSLTLIDTLDTLAVLLPHENAR
jgi:mannosidase alpha-like ER degradation enhancer 1